MGEMTPEAWGEKYRLSWATYRSLSQRVKNLIQEIISSAGIDVVQIEARAKEVDSFTEKIIRKEGQYSNPLTEITDLAGVRIIVYYREDVSKVCELIEQEFDIDRDNSIDKSRILDADRFGYNSVHYVATLSNTRSGLSEWRAYKAVKFEIQVRTVLQHAWAAVDHKIAYKSTKEAPAGLRRSLFALSALFELADEQFSLINANSRKIQAEYQNEVAEGRFDVPLNDLSLRAYIESHPQIAATKEELSALGFIHSESPMTPARFARASRILQAAGIASLSDLNSAIIKDLPQAVDFVKKDSQAGMGTVIATLILIARGVQREGFEDIFSPETMSKYQETRDAFLSRKQGNLPANER